MLPVFKWVGSKYKTVSIYNKLGLIPDLKDTFVLEPFAGSASFSLSSDSKHIYLNDLSYIVYVFWLTVKEYPESLYRSCVKLDEETNYHSGLCYEHVKREYNARLLEKTNDYSRLCALFLYLNRNGFNGLYRVNSRGEYNVPWCREPKRRFYSIYNFYKGLSNKIKVICNMDYKEFLCCFSNEDLRNSFVYLDPPYLNVFNSYTPTKFQYKDYVELERVCRELDSIGCRFALASIDHTSIRSLYSDFHIYELDSFNYVSCANRSKRKELLITNYTPTT